MCNNSKNDVGNINSPNTIVAPITNTSGNARVSVQIRNQYFYNNGNDQLTGYILLQNIVTVSKSRLSDYLVTLTNEVDEVNEKILVSLGMFGKYKALKDANQRDRIFIQRINHENQLMKNILTSIANEVGAENYEQILERIATSK